MATTPAQIIEGAYRRSKLAGDGLLIEETTEGLATVNASVRSMFMIAARINPEYFGATAAVPFSAGGWPRPDTAESVFYMEHEGERVVVVPLVDRQAARAEKAVYRLARKYMPAGNDGDPEGGVLNVWHARLPVASDAVTTPIDEDWPEPHNDLLELETAIYLAVKDGRAEEVGGLVDQRDRALRLFLAHLEHETTNEVRRFSRRYAPDVSVVPMESLLAGGTNVRMDLEAQAHGGSLMRRRAT